MMPDRGRAVLGHVEEGEDGRERGSTWAESVGRTLGLAVRAVTDGVDALAGLFSPRSEGRARAAASQGAQLEVLLGELGERVTQHAEASYSSLAQDDEFWRLLERVRRARAQGVGRAPVPSAAHAATPVESAEEEPASTALVPAQPQAIERMEDALAGEGESAVREPRAETAAAEEADLLAQAFEPTSEPTSGEESEPALEGEAADFLPEGLAPYVPGEAVAEGEAAAEAEPKPEAESPAERPASPEPERRRKR